MATGGVPTRWKKGKRLGRGGFGEVFQCYDQDTGRTLAVKEVQVIGGNAAFDKELGALQSEIRLHKDISHERIVRYYGSKSDRRILSIFMEYVPGTSLSEHMKTYGPFSEKVTRKYTRQILEGLSYLHGHKIIHRDIKGANILQDPSGNIKLCDFGVSKQLEVMGTMHGANTSIGTKLWMSPEALQGIPYGVETDIWSLGCTIVEMLTTNPPWFGDIRAPLDYNKIVRADHPKYKLPSDASPLVKEFLMLCFKKNPKERPAANELIKHSFCNMDQETKPKQPQPRPKQPHPLHPPHPPQPKPKQPQLMWSVKAERDQSWGMAVTLSGYIIHCNGWDSSPEFISMNGERRESPFIHTMHTDVRSCYSADVHSVTGDVVVACPVAVLYVYKANNDTWLSPTRHDIKQHHLAPQVAWTGGEGDVIVAGMFNGPMIKYNTVTRKQAWTQDIQVSAAAHVLDIFVDHHGMIYTCCPESTDIGVYDSASGSLMYRVRPQIPDQNLSTLTSACIDDKGRLLILHTNPGVVTLWQRDGDRITYIKHVLTHLDILRDGGTRMRLHDNWYLVIAGQNKIEKYDVHCMLS